MRTAVRPPGRRGLRAGGDFVAALKRSQRVRVIITTIVVVAIVAIGAVFLLRPGGSTSASTSTAATPVEVVDPPVVEPPPKIVPLAASKKVPTTAGIESQLAAQLANPELAQFSGIVIDPTTGEVIWSKDA